MPRSKRNKQAELARIKKRGLEWKKNLFEQIRSCVDSYENVFVFSVNDMRNSKMKNVRDQFKDSRFFIGKNKIMAMALGRSAEEEYKPNLHKIGQQVKGQCGLLFSNRSTEEILSWFRSYSEGDYARSGNTATEDVTLNAGPLPMFPHSLEPYLRQLGLPTSLVKGVIHLVKDHEVCKEGDVLTPETAKILKLLGYEMAEFHITINCVWSQDASFMQLAENIQPDIKENIKKKSPAKNKSLSKSAIEEMEVETNEASESDESETENAPCIISPKTNEMKPLKFGNIANTSTPKEKVQDSEESTTKLQHDSFVTTEKNEDMFCIDSSSEPKKKKGETLDDEYEKVNDKQEEVEKTVNNQKIENDDKKSRRRKVAKNNSLQKIQDTANSSQESPVFRELRSRSVKVTRKKNK